MKKIILFLYAVIILHSCAKHDLLLNPAESSDMKVRFEKLEAIQNIKAQQISFDMLSPTEKCDLWRFKFEDFLKNKNLTNNQRSFVKLVMKHLHPNVFDRSRPEAKIFQINTIDKLLSTGKEHFSQAQLFELFFDLSNTRVRNTTNLMMEEPGTGEIDNGQQRQCICAIGSKYTCGRATGWISVEYGDCSVRNCVITNSGCGAFWAYDCDGSTCSYGKS